MTGTRLWWDVPGLSRVATKGRQRLASMDAAAGSGYPRQSQRSYRVSIQQF
jgi:hypothetical protein